MATPTPGKHAQGQAVATPSVSTPFSSNHMSHPAFSPHGPRSVMPSPQQIKKSPANSHTAYAHGTNTSFGAGYDSPSAAMALGGINGLSDLGLDGLGVVGLKRDDEEERRRKLVQVSEILKANKGRVSEAGIERLARKVGLECLWETHMGSGGSTRTLIIAGSALALDIDFENNVVKKVSLAFPESPAIVTRHTEKAGDILLPDLQLQGKESPLTKMLDRFAANLERLATLDKLSVIPTLNCHEAIAGVYESLERLHTWEIERLREDEGRETDLEQEVMCTKSGKPVMHTRDRLGLSLDYWQDRRKLTPKNRGKIWSILVECDASTPGMLYTPIRISDDWISVNVQKPIDPTNNIFMVAESEPTLDWLEPENLMLPTTETSKAGSMGIIDPSSSQKIPGVMFVAKFDPPLIVPYNLAVQIYNSANAAIDLYQQTTYDELIFPPGTPDKPENDGRKILHAVKIPVFSKTDEKRTCIHRHGIYFEKKELGRTLTVLPFGHPRQLVEILPALRQYALMTNLLVNTFGSDLTLSESDILTKQHRSNREEFEYFINAPELNDLPLRVDIKVSKEPFPQLRVLFPFRKRTADVIFEVKLNGVVEVISQNILPDLAPTAANKKNITTADLARMLEITEDLGIWVEFVKRRFE